MFKHLLITLNSYPFPYVPILHVSSQRIIRLFFRLIIAKYQDHELMMIDVTDIILSYFQN